MVKWIWLIHMWCDELDGFHLRMVGFQHNWAKTKWTFWRATNDRVEIIGSLTHLFKLNQFRYHSPFLRSKSKSHSFTSQIFFKSRIFMIIAIFLFVHVFLARKLFSRTKVFLIEFHKIYAAIKVWCAGCLYERYLVFTLYSIQVFFSFSLWLSIK